MLNIPMSTKIYVASEPVDIRKGMDALAGWVEENGLDVYSGHLFVFLSKRMTHVKVLTWSRGGFVLLCKRLEEGRFPLTRPRGKRAHHLDRRDRPRHAPRRNRHSKGSKTQSLGSHSKGGRHARIDVVQRRGVHP